MGPPPNSKHDEPRITDLEGGDQTSHNIPVQPRHDLEPSTPDTRSSREYDGAGAQDNSAVDLRWKKIWNKIPQPVASRLRNTGRWFRGPQPPRIYRIKPLFEPIQTFPARFIGRLPKIVRFGLLFVIVALWIVLFAVVLSKRGFPTNFLGYGAPVRLSCTNRLW